MSEVKIFKWSLWVSVCLSLSLRFVISVWMFVFLRFFFPLRLIPVIISGFAWKYLIHRCEFVCIFLLVDFLLFLCGWLFPLRLFFPFFSYSQVHEVQILMSLLFSVTPLFQCLYFRQNVCASLNMIIEIAKLPHPRFPDKH